MEFKVKKREVEISVDSHSIDTKIANEFKTHLVKELGPFLRSVVLFGSKTHENKKSFDVDVLVIIDDVTTILDRNLQQTYKIITKNIANKISKKLHINTLRMSSFWEYVRNGDPIVINMLRDGYVLHDTNLFTPIQMLLMQGRIRPTKESMWNYFSRAPLTLNNSKWHILQATVDLYWAVVDSAHAALMKGDVLPPSPEHVAELLEQRYVKKKLLEKKYPELMRKFYRLMKMISHRDIKEISGQQYDIYFKEAQGFVERMKKIID